MQSIIRWLILNKSMKATKEICNITSIDGYTPAMICAKNDHPDTFFVMMSYDCVDFEFENMDSHNIEDMCRDYSPKCLKILLERKLNRVLDVKGGDLDISVQNGIISEIIRKFIRSENMRRRYRDRYKMYGQDGINPDLKVAYLLSKYRSTPWSYEDPDFPKCTESVCSKENHRYYDAFRKAVWKRPHEIFDCFPKDVELFRDIDPLKIRMGILGVTFFDAACAAICEYPVALQSIFINDKSNKNGAYSMIFYIKGIPIEICVDDYFPCYGHVRDPIFARSQERELWLMLLQKAWAKIFELYFFGVWKGL